MVSPTFEEKWIIRAKVGEKRRKVEPRPPPSPPPSLPLLYGNRGKLRRQARLIKPPFVFERGKLDALARFRSFRLLQFSTLFDFSSRFLEVVDAKMSTRLLLR